MTREDALEIIKALYHFGDDAKFVWERDYAEEFGPWED